MSPRKSAVESERTRHRLHRLVDYYSLTRGGGHTFALKEVAQKLPQSRVLCASQNHASREFGRQGISWENLDQLRGQRNALLIDHDALVGLLFDVLKEFQRLDQLIREDRADA